MNESEPISRESAVGKHGLWAKKRSLALVGILVIFGVVAWSYAATFLSVSNVATIQTGATLVATGPVGAGTACSAGTGTYTNSPTVDWANVPRGTAQSKFICVENTGTESYLVSLTSDLPSADGSITSPQSGQTIAPASFILVEIDWNVSMQAPLGGVSFTITFQ